MEHLINLDKELFLFLNGLGSEPFDGFWKIITKQIYWSPLFVGVFYLIQKKLGWKGLGIIILFLAVLLTFTDQITNLFKYSFERLRPCNNPEFDGLMREVITRKSFSFFLISNNHLSPAYSKRVGSKRDCKYSWLIRFTSMVESNTSEVLSIPNCSKIEFSFFFYIKIITSKDVS